MKNKGNRGNVEDIGGIVESFIKAWFYATVIPVGLVLAIGVLTWALGY